MSSIKLENSKAAQNEAARRGVGIAAFEYQLPIREKLARVARLGADRCELAIPGDLTLGTAAEAAEAVAESGVRVTAVASLSKPNAPGETETDPAARGQHPVR